MAVSHELSEVKSEVCRQASRRLYGFLVTGRCVGEIARHGVKTIDVKSPVPDSASFFTAFFDNSRNAFVCVFEDESFDEVAEGAVIPVGSGPWITRMEDNQASSEL